MMASLHPLLLMIGASLFVITAGGSLYAGGSARAGGSPAHFRRRGRAFAHEQTRAGGAPSLGGGRQRGRRGRSHAGHNRCRDRQTRSLPDALVDDLPVHQRGRGRGCRRRGIFHRTDRLALAAGQPAPAGSRRLQLLSPAAIRRALCATARCPGDDRAFGARRLHGARTRCGSSARRASGRPRPNSAG